MDYSEIRSAKARLDMPGRPFLRKTPLWRVPGALLGVPCAELWLKLEHQQVSGSFKARGMLNRLLAQPIPAVGVIVASGGNAGIAVAAAAQALQVPCEVFVPTSCPAAKQARLRELGATVVQHGAVYAEAFQASVARQAATGALMAHAYDQPEVVAGAGTLALEIAEQAGTLPHQVLVSVGGGGLVAGLALGFDGLARLAGPDSVRPRIVALEPELAPTLAAARAAGQPVDVDVGGIAADALGARRIGAIAWQMAQRGLIHESLLLPDAVIAAAQREMWQLLRLAVEAAAALPLAALRHGAIRPAPHEHLCLIVCGANVDLGKLA